MNMKRENTTNLRLPFYFWFSPFLLLIGICFNFTWSLDSGVETSLGLKFLDLVNHIGFQIPRSPELVALISLLFFIPASFILYKTKVLTDKKFVAVLYGISFALCSTIILLLIITFVAQMIVFI